MAVGEKGGHAFAAGVGSMPPQHHPLQNGIFGAVAASGTLPPANMAPGAFYGLPQQQAFSGVVAQQSPHGSLGLPVPQQRLAWNQMSGGAPFGLQGASSNPFLVSSTIFQVLYNLQLKMLSLSLSFISLYCIV